MKCPRCALDVTDAVPRCLGCGFTVADLDRVLGQPPKRDGAVLDEASMLSPEERVALAARVRQLSDELNGELVIVTTPNARGVRPAQLAFWLFNRWQVGGPTHAGLLVLVTREERWVQCEVGYTWEGAISDDEAGDVLDEAVVPHLREGRFADGLLAGIEALAAPLRSLQRESERTSAGGVA